MVATIVPLMLQRECTASMRLLERSSHPHRAPLPSPSKIGRAVLMRAQDAAAELELSYDPPQLNSWKLLNIRLGDAVMQRGRGLKGMQGMQEHRERCPVQCTSTN